MKSHLKHCKILPHPQPPERPPHRLEPGLHVRAGPGEAGVPSRSKAGKTKSFPGLKLACRGTVPLPPQLPHSRPLKPLSDFARCHLAWSAAPGGHGAPPLRARGQISGSWGTGRHRGRPARPPGSTARLTSLLLLRLQADGDVLLPARHGVCSLSWLRGSLVRSLLAGSWARRASWLTPSGR